MKKVFLIIIMLFSVPLYGGGHGTKKPDDGKSKLIKSVVELLNSRSKSKKDTLKRKKDEKKKIQKKKKRKHRR